MVKKEETVRKLLTDGEWIKKLAANTLSSKQRDYLRRHWRKTRIELVKSSIIFGMLPVPLFVLSNELDYWFIQKTQGVCGSYWDVPDDISVARYGVLAVQALTTVVTLLCCAFLHKYWVMGHQIAIVDNEGVLGTFWNTKFGRQCAVEMFICALHIPVGVSVCFKSDVWDTFGGAFGRGKVYSPIYYRLQVFTPLVFLLRVFLIFRYMVSSNRFSTMLANTVVSIFSHDGSKTRLAFLDTLGSVFNRVLFFSFIYYGSILVGAYSIWVFERDYDRSATIYRPGEMTWGVSLWFTWTITQPGFADYMALTSMGRGVVLIVAFIATVAQSIFTSFLITLVELNDSQRQIAYTMDWLFNRESKVYVAAVMIQKWFSCLHKNRKGKKDRVRRWDAGFMRGRALWRRHIKSEPRFKGNPTEMTSALPQMREVRQMAQNAMNRMDELSTTAVQQLRSYQGPTDDEVLHLRAGIAELRKQQDTFEEVVHAQVSMLSDVLRWMLQWQAARRKLLLPTMKRQIGTATTLQDHRNRAKEPVAMLSVDPTVMADEQRAAAANALNRYPSPSSVRSGSRHGSPSRYVPSETHDVHGDGDHRRTVGDQNAISQLPMDWNSTPLSMVSMNASSVHVNTMRMSSTPSHYNDGVAFVSNQGQGNGVPPAAVAQRQVGLADAQGHGLSSRGVASGNASIVSLATGSRLDEDFEDIVRQLH